MIKPTTRPTYVVCYCPRIWLIHVVRGLPAGRFQSCCGMSRDLESTASFRALCAGVLASKRRIWPKKEWRRAAMVLSMLGRFVLSATALLVMKSFHLTPRICLWHVMWNACSLRESSFNSVQVSAPWRPTSRSLLNIKIKAQRHWGAMLRTTYVCQKLQMHRPGGASAGCVPVM